MKVVAPGVSGLNFALSSGELLQVLQSRFGFTPATSPSLPSTPAAELTRPVLASITSDPAGAEIEIDGVFVGNTPSEISIQSGSHAVKITKKGFKPFERTMSVSTGSKPTINAEMEKVE
jgi:hypothetical protein